MIKSKVKLPKEEYSKWWIRPILFSIAIIFFALFILLNIYSITPINDICYDYLDKECVEKEEQAKRFYVDAGFWFLVFGFVLFIASLFCPNKTDWELLQDEVEQKKKELKDKKAVKLWEEQVKLALKKKRRR